MERRSLIARERVAEAPPATGSALASLATTALVTVLAILVITLLAAAPSGAAPKQLIWDPDATPSWTAQIAGAGAADDTATDVAMLEGGVMMVAGTSWDGAADEQITLTRLVGSDVRWTKTWRCSVPDEDSMNAKLAMSPDGAATYIAGTTLKAGHLDIVLLKWSTRSGRLLWTRRYDGPAHLGDRPVAIGVDRSGAVTVLGDSQSARSTDWVVIRWSAQGARRWVWGYDGRAHDYDSARDLLVSADGSVYATGVSILVGPWPAAATARLTSRGKKAWLKTYAAPGGFEAESTAIAPRPGGGVYICGAAAASAGGVWADGRGLVIGYAANGRRSVFDLDAPSLGITSNHFDDLAVTATGDVVAVGLAVGGQLAFPHLAVYRPNGAISTAGSRVGQFDGWYQKVVADSFGGFYATGSQYTGANDEVIATVRSTTLASGGVWRSEWQVLPSAHNHPVTVAVRATTVCVVGSCDSGGATGRNQAVLVYNY